MAIWDIAVHWRNSGKSELVAVTLAGLYDKAGEKWREPVNAPNRLWTKIICNGQPLSVHEHEPSSHVQELNIRSAIHHRSTEYDMSDGGTLTFTADRFVSQDNLHLLVSKCSIHSTQDTGLPNCN